MFCLTTSTRLFRISKIHNNLCRQFILVVPAISHNILRVIFVFLSLSLLALRTLRSVSLRALCALWKPGFMLQTKLQALAQHAAIDALRACGERNI